MQKAISAWKVSRYCLLAFPGRAVVLGRLNRPLSLKVCIFYFAKWVIQALISWVMNSIQNGDDQSEMLEIAYLCMYGLT